MLATDMKEIVITVNIILAILESEEARTWGTRIFVATVAFDFLLSYDRIPENSVRERLLTATQRGLWLLPGSVFPYGLGVLVGHFYHPAWPSHPFPVGGYWNLAVVVAIGLLLAVTTRVWHFPKSSYVAIVALFGMVVGTIIWPVGITI